MMISTFSKNTAQAVILTVGLVFVIFIYTMLAGFLSMVLADNIVGPVPVIEYSYNPQVIGNSSADNQTYYSYQTYANDEYNQYNTRRSQTQAQIYDTLATLSPFNAYAGFGGYGLQGVGYALIMKEDNSIYRYSGVYGIDYTVKEISLVDALMASWLKVLALVMEIAAAFGIAYVVFMRADVR
jgi:ABC-type transport system involved in multi-copper enzyme maturation permease subunit